MSVKVRMPAQWLKLNNQLCEDYYVNNYEVLRFAQYKLEEALKTVIWRRMGQRLSETLEMYDYEV